MPSRPIVSELTDEQAALIPIYQEKWRAIQNSVERVDWDRAIEAVNSVYVVSNYPEPKILLYSNPLIAIQEVACIENFKSYLGRDIRNKLSKRVFDHIYHTLAQQLDDKFFIRLRNRTLHTEFPYYSTYDKPQTSYFPYSVMSCLEHQLVFDLERTKPDLDPSDISYLASWVSRPAEWAGWACFFDFCISVLKLHHDKNKWQVIQQLIQTCGFVFQFENVCIACDRPSKLSYDEENLLHADGEPALQFADGYGVYANHGKSPFSDW